MKVYHGSTLVIEHPIADAGRDRLDFGRGFYVTSIQQQAQSWAIRMSRIRQQPGIVNIYEFDLERALRNFSYIQYKEYDSLWLQFIVANRRGKNDIIDADMVEGGVANDRVIDTVEAYMSGLMPMEVALGKLAIHVPNNQLCFRSQSVLDECLRFVESYRI